MNRKLRIIYVPYDSGHRSLRMGSGPDAFRETGIARGLRSSGFEVAEETLGLPEGFVLEAGSAFRINRQIAERVRRCESAGELPIVFSGNCHASVGVLSGQGSKDVAIFWFDGHGDYNTPDTSPSGYFDGMALAILTGKCWKTGVASIPGFASIPDRNVLLLGPRDLDPGELETVASSDATWLKPDDFRTERLEQAVRSMQEVSANAHIHVDLDVLEGAEVPVNEYSGTGGISVSELLRAISLIQSQFTLRSLTIAAYDPAVDPDQKAIRATQSLLQTLFPTP